MRQADAGSMEQPQPLRCNLLKLFNASMDAEVFPPIIIVDF